MFSPVIFSRGLGQRLFAFNLGIFASIAASANPQGPSVIAGTVGFAAPNPQTLDVTNAPGAIINWQSFDIGVGETTRFIQQDAASAVLNRVTTANTSEIFGQLLSNGHVFLINPAGMLIGRDAVIDTAGLVMSTLDIKDADFAAGKLHFEGGPTSGGITNHGYIKTAANGEIVLIAPKILNAPEAGAAGVESKSGIIESPNGQLILAAGYSITLSSLNDPNISFEVRAPENSVVNLGALIAKGGTARVLASTIKNAGEINADTLTVDKTGRVMLVASDRVETTPASRISAQGADGLVGGAVTVEAKQVAVSGEINVSGDSAGGTAHVLGDDVTTIGANVLANSAHGDGGQIRVGGEYQGGAALRAANTTKVDAASRFEASAGEQGHGGKIVTWSNQETSFAGTAVARGGAHGGNGGFVEVSGHETLRFNGSVDVGAPKGDSGTLLLDPRTIIIVQGSATASANNPNPFAGDLFGAAGSISILGGNRILVSDQSAHVNGLANVGTVTLLDTFGTILGSLSGNTAGERLGSNFLNATGGNRLFLSPTEANGTLAGAGAVILFNLTNGTEIGRLMGTSANEALGSNVTSLSSFGLGSNFVVRSTLADVGGATDAGAVILLNGVTGTEVGRVSGGTANERLGTLVDFFNIPTGTYLLRSPNATPNGANSGSAILVNNTTGLEIGRTNGLTAGDLLGTNGPVIRGSGNYFLQVPNATVGGNANAGSLVLVGGTTGQRIGSIDGNAVNEFLGSSIDQFSLGFDSVLIRATGHTVSGFANAGAVIVAADVDLGGGVIERGRTSGQSASEFYGSTIDFDFFGTVPTGTYLVRSSSADVGGLANAGVAVLVNKTNGQEIGRTSGLTAGDLLGNVAPILRASGNYFLPVPNATIGLNANAGSLVLVNGATGQAIGSVDGTAFSESLSNLIDRFSLGGSNVLITSVRHDNPGIVAVNDLAGGVFVAADVDLGGGTSGSHGSGNILRGKTLGQSQNEFLGIDGVIFRGANYFIPSRNFTTAGGLANAGSIILVDGTTGNELGRLDGNTANERLGCLNCGATASRIDQFSLFSNGDLLLYAPTHGAGQGLVAQIKPDFGLGTVVRGTPIAGLTTGDGVGEQNAIFLGNNGNYLLPVPTLDNTLSQPNVGGAYLVSRTTGAILNPVTLGAPVLIGDTVSEALGTPSKIDTSTLSFKNIFVVGSPLHGGSSKGALFFVNSLTGAITKRFDGNVGDQVGSDPIQFANSGNLIVPMPNASLGFAGAGAVALLDGTSFNFLGRTDGISFNERFGSSGQIDTRSLFGADFLVHSQNRSTTDLSGGTSLEGAVVIVSGTAGTVLGAVSGQRPLDHLGELAFAQVLSNGNFLLFNPSANTTGPLSRAGAVILVDAVNHLEIGGAGNGRIYGQSNNEALGSSQFVFERSNGNYFIQSPNASPGSVPNAGSVYLANSATGLRLGQVDGTFANERFGSNIDTSILGASDDILVISQFHNVGAFTNAGTVVQLAAVDLGVGGFGGNNIVRGRVDGSSINEQLGSGGVQRSDSTHYFIQSIFADVGGNIDAGSIHYVSMVTGREVNRIDGISAGEQIGTVFSGSPGPGIFQGSNGNWFIKSKAAVGGLTNAGRIIVVDGSGAVLGTASGDTAEERFGAQTLTVDRSLWVVSSQHSKGAGGIFALTDQNLGGGNIIQKSLLGQPNDRFGSEFIFTQRTIGNNFIVPNSGATVNGITGAGTVLLVDRSLNVVGQTSGTSQDEFFGSKASFAPQINGNLLVGSPNADINGLVDAGTLKLISGTTGTLIGETSGKAAGDRFGDINNENGVFFTRLRDGTIVVTNPDANVGGLTHAGAIVQIDQNTGLEKQRIVGISQDERLGSRNEFAGQLPDGRLVFGSPHTALSGAIDAGRVVIFDGITQTQIQQSNLLFSNTPNGDFVVTTGSIENALNSGANLILQANNDILIQKGVVLNGGAGSLTLQAGRSIIVNGLLNLQGSNLRMVANESPANGADPKNRSTGPGDFVLTDPQIVAKQIDLSAQNVIIRGGVDPKAPAFLPTTGDQLFADFLKTGALGSPATFILGLDRLTVNATTIDIFGGASPGAFAGLASFGGFDITADNITLTTGTGTGAHSLLLGLGGLANITFKTCTGCGTDPLFTDPFLEFVPRSGIFIAGLSFDQPIQAILAMNRKSEKDDKEKKKDKDAKQCGI